MFSLIAPAFLNGDIWEEMDRVMNSALSCSEQRLSNNGLRQIIKRPHNLYSIKDDKGNVIKNKLEVVTTPFKKSDVNVSILDGVLTVECGPSNHVDEDAESMVWHGISSQSYKFSLKLSERIDQNKIEAKVEDGILTIDMPFYPDLGKADARKIEVK